MKIKVRRFDGYFEEFDATEFRSGDSILWIRLVNSDE